MADFTNLEQFITFPSDSNDDFCQEDESSQNIEVPVNCQRSGTVQNIAGFKLKDECEQYLESEEENDSVPNTFLDSKEGSTLVALFREFLDYLGLKFTISAYEAEIEVGKYYEYSGRTKLANDLRLDPDAEGPLIAQVLPESIVCPSVGDLEAPSNCLSANRLMKEEPRPTSYDYEDIALKTEDTDLEEELPIIESEHDVDFIKQDPLAADYDPPKSYRKTLPCTSGSYNQLSKRLRVEDNPTSDKLSSILRASSSASTTFPSRQCGGFTSSDQNIEQASDEVDFSDDNELLRKEIERTIFPNVRYGKKRVNMRQNKSDKNKTEKNESPSHVNNSKHFLTVSTTTNIGKRCFDRQDCCIFCDRLVKNFSKHMLQKHAEEKEVCKILSIPKGSTERRLLFDKLRKKGNFYHNTNCLKDKSGAFIVVRRPTNESSAAKYLPCKICFGFFSKRLLFKHVKTCKHSRDGESSRNAHIAGTALLTLNMSCSSTLRATIFPIMRGDEISKAAQEDELICEFGARMLNPLKGKNMKCVISQKMRELGRLKLECKARIQSSSSGKQTKLESLEDYLVPDLYNRVVECVYSLAGFNVNTGVCKSPSLVMKLRSSLRSCAEIMQCKGRIAGNAAATKRSKQFSYLLSRMSVYNVSINTSRTLHADLNKKKLPEDTEHLKRPLSENESDWDEVDDEVIDASYKPGRTSNNNSSKKRQFKGLKKRSLVDHKKTNDKSQQKERRKCIKVPWTVDEKKAVLRHFDKHVHLKKVPNKEECDKCLETELVLSNRSWRHIKFCVKNMIKK